MTSWSLRENPREDLIHRTIDASGKVVHNLRNHASGYPDSTALGSDCASVSTARLRWSVVKNTAPKQEGEQLCARSLLPGRVC